jgi:hypothetical protein
LLFVVHRNRLRTRAFSPSSGIKRITRFWLTRAGIAFLDGP